MSRHTQMTSPDLCLTSEGFCRDLGLGGDPPPPRTTHAQYNDQIALRKAPQNYQTLRD